MAQPYKPGNNGLTNNYKANMAILAIAATGYLAASFLAPGLLHKKTGVNADAESLQVWLHIAIFSVSYYLTSFWFSPDLDLRKNRPGHNTFPLRPLMKILNLLKRKTPLIGGLFGLVATAASPIHELLNMAWRAFWHPFGHLFTHRGIVHFPVIGTHLKLAYLFAAYWCVFWFTDLLGIMNPPFISGDFVEDAIGKSGFYTHVLETPLLLTALIGASVADICHSAVDYWDSAKKGSKFVPPEAIAPKGFIYSSFRFFKKRLVK